MEGKITAPSGIFSDSLTISGVPVATGTAPMSTLQEAYDSGDGFIRTVGSKPVTISGTPAGDAALTVFETILVKPDENGNAV